MVCYKKGFCERSPKRSLDNITPPIQFRSQLLLNIENSFHQLSNTIPKIIFIYNFIKRFNMKFFLTVIGIQNKWAILAILLLI